MKILQERYYVLISKKIAIWFEMVAIWKCGNSECDNLRKWLFENVTISGSGIEECGNRKNWQFEDAATLERAVWEGGNMSTVLDDRKTDNKTISASGNLSLWT